jgi:hypothetical protein
MKIETGERSVAKSLGSTVVGVIRASLLVVLSVVLIGVFALLLVPRDRGYFVSAETETLRVVVTDPAGTATRLPFVRLGGNADTTYTRAELQISAGVEIQLARKRESDLLVQLNWPEGSGGNAQLVTSDGDLVQLQPGAILRVGLQRPGPEPSDAPMQDTVLMAYQGQVDLGADVARLVETTLLSGRVAIIERQPLSAERYVVHQSALDPGDHVLWRTVSGAPSNAVAGFVQVGNGSALQVTAHAAADYMLVERFGAVGYVLRPSIWERVASDPVINGLLLALGFVSTLFGLFEAAARMRAK